MTYADIIERISWFKRSDDGVYYDSYISQTVARDKIDAINDTVDEIINFLQDLSDENYVISNEKEAE